MNEKQYPNEPGLYFARNGTFKWWNLVVSVNGLQPFLYIEWAVNRGALESKAPIYYKLDPSDVIFGPLIECPEVKE